MTETQEGIAETFAALGQALAGFNQEGEAFSFTINISSCPGKGPVVAMLGAPGTTQEHADGLRDSVVAALLEYK